jgi:hypothetical protein
MFRTLIPFQALLVPFLADFLDRAWQLNIKISLVIALAAITYRLKLSPEKEILAVFELAQHILNVYTCARRRYERNLQCINNFWGNVRWRWIDWIAIRQIIKLMDVYITTFAAIPRKEWLPIARKFALYVLYIRHIFYYTLFQALGR